MDKEKFIKKAKEYEYTDEGIDEMIKEYEITLKRGLDIDLTILLIDKREMAITSVLCSPETFLKLNTIS